jgi:hypothetical protein
MSPGREDKIMAKLEEIQSLLEQRIQPAVSSKPVDTPENGDRPPYDQDLFAAFPAKSLMVDHTKSPERAAPSLMLLNRAFEALPAFPVIESVSWCTLQTSQLTSSDQLLIAYHRQGQMLEVVSMPHFFQRWNKLKQFLAIIAEPLCSCQEAITLATCFDILASALLRLPHRHVAIAALFEYLGQPVKLKEQATKYQEVSTWIVNRVSEEACRNSPGIFLNLATTWPSYEYIELMLLKIGLVCDTRTILPIAGSIGAQATQAALTLNMHKLDVNHPDYERASRLYWTLFLLEKVSSSPCRDTVD